MISSLISKYDSLTLECDGLTRVIHTVLSKHEVGHVVKVGSISLGEESMSPHFWIELSDGSIVDYRARMWLGSEASHGIFKKSKVVYDGDVTGMSVLDDFLFKLLTGEKSDI